MLHRCDRPECCNAAHYFLGTDMDNRIDCVRKRRQATMDTHNSRTNPDSVLRATLKRAKKLNPERAEQIIDLIEAGLSDEEIGPMFGVASYTIRGIRKGERWSQFLRKREKSPAALIAQAKEDRIKAIRGLDIPGSELLQLLVELNGWNSVTVNLSHMRQTITATEISKLEDSR